MKFYLLLRFCIIGTGFFGKLKCNPLLSNENSSKQQVTYPNSLIKNELISNLQSSEENLMDLKIIKNQFNKKFDQETIPKKFQLISFFLKTEKME